MIPRKNENSGNFWGKIRVKIEKKITFQKISAFLMS